MADIKVILELTDSSTFEISNNYINNLETTSQSISDSSIIQYGSLANTGKIEIIDKDDTIRNMIESGLLANSNVPVIININGKNIQSHITTDSSYSLDSKILSISFSNRISNWENIEFSGRQLTEQTTAFVVLCDVLSLIGKTESEVEQMCTGPFYMYNFEVYTISEYLKSINIEYPYIEGGTFKEAVDKICELAQLNVFEDNDGNIRFISQSPIVDLGRQIPIRIPLSNQFSELSYDPFVKNKITGVDYEKIDLEYSYQNVASMTNTYYEQTSDTTYVTIEDEYERIAYSGMKASYNSSISTNSNDAEIIGVYPVWWNDSELNYERMFALFSISFVVDETSMYDNWILYESSRNENKVPLRERPLPLSVVVNFLKNETSVNNIGEFLSRYTNDFTFVANREEALNNLCHYSGTDIDAIHPNKGMQIVKQGNKFTVYAVWNLTINIPDAARPVGYIGDLDYIVLGNTLTLATNVIKKESMLQEGNNSNYEIKINELIASNTTVFGNNIAEIIKQSIERDYGGGIVSATITISCGDYYNTYGDLVIDWHNGDIIEIGDIILLDSLSNANKLWKVTGVTLKYKGVPRLYLELQQAKLYEQLEAGIYNEDGELIKTFQQLIDEGAITMSTSGSEVTSSNASQLNGILILSNNVVSIGNMAFNNCAFLTRIIVPSSVTSIGNAAFMSCTSLTDITITSSVVSMGENVFWNCTSLTSITLPNSIANISSGMFHLCSSLSSIEIPSSVTSIGDMAFDQCTSLQSINIPSSVTNIGYNAFYNCNALTSITIPSGITSIDNYTFYNCYSLTNITIPSGVTSIGNNAFYNCNSITTYDFSQCTQVPSLANEYVFYYINSLAKIIVPDSLYDEWVGTQYWSTYSQYIYKASEV